MQLCCECIRQPVHSYVVVVDGHALMQDTHNRLCRAACSVSVCVVCVHVHMCTTQQCSAELAIFDSDGMLWNGLYITFHYVFGEGSTTFSSHSFACVRTVDAVNCKCAKHNHHSRMANDGDGDVRRSDKHLHAAIKLINHICVCVCRLLSIVRMCPLVHTESCFFTVEVLGSGKHAI